MEKKSILEACPDLVKEWSFVLNGEVTLENVTRGSHKKVWWVCDEGHEWKAAVYNRVSGKGCPYCVNKKVCQDNCLAILQPNIAKEWHPTLNGTLTPKNVTCGSHKKVWWLCRKCFESWSAVIYGRCGGGNKCPYCSGHRVCKKTCLATLRPDIVREWDFLKNGDITPNNVSVGSGVKVWWVCSKCSYGWRSFVYHRTGGHSCPRCSRGNVSPVSQQWLDLLGIPQENREYFLLDLKFRVDGFDPTSNTSYEFFGDYWHGNPEIFSPAEKNSHNGKTFGQLFEDTKTRIFRLEEAGYKVVYIWESDYRKLCLSVTKNKAMITEDFVCQS